MEIALISVSALLLLVSLLLFKEKKNNNALKRKCKETDQMLTKYVAENIDMEKQLSQVVKDYDAVKEMSKEIVKVQEQGRRLKHDMKNHTMVMLSFFEENRIDDAKKYAGEILDKLNKMYTYVNVGNSLLNYIINNKLSKAKENGIEIKAEIENLSFDYMEGVDFSTMLNNVLDNAIEASINSKEKKLEVKICSNKGVDVITVKNSIDSSVIADNPSLMSTKEEEGHGYGVKQIKAIVEKYSGEIDIYEKEEMFVISIMLFVTE